MVILANLQKFIEELHLVSVESLGVSFVDDVTDELLPLNEVRGSLLKLHVLCHFPLNLIQHQFDRWLKQFPDGEVTVVILLYFLVAEALGE